MLGILQVGEQAYADRYTYFPHIGLPILVTWGFYELSFKIAATVGPKFMRVGVAVAMASIISLATTTARQVQVWKDSGTLWTHALNSGHDSFNLRNNLGLWFFDNRRYAEALDQFQHIESLPNPRSNGYANLGFTLIRLGRCGDAIAYLRKANDLAPNQSYITQRLARALECHGNLAEARHFWELTAVLAGLRGGTLFNLGCVLRKMQLTEEADKILQTAERQEPTWRQQTFAYAWHLATDPGLDPRDPLEAIYQANLLYCVDGKDPQILDLVAAASADAGDFETAKQMGLEALTIAATNAEFSALKVTLAGHWDSYQKHTPLRIPPPAESTH
jgi:tetratricopeptide (TPR) repeat protein